MLKCALKGVCNGSRDLDSPQLVQYSAGVHTTALLHVG